MAGSIAHNHFVMHAWHLLACSNHFARLVTRQIVVFLYRHRLFCADADCIPLSPISITCLAVHVDFVENTDPWYVNAENLLQFKLTKCS